MHYEAPTGVLTPADKQALREHKETILELLNQYAATAPPARVPASIDLAMLPGTACTLLRTLLGTGVQVALDDSFQLTVKPPEGGMLPHGLLAAIRPHVRQIEALLERWEEKAAILEYMDDYPRAEAERLAWAALGIVAPVVPRAEETAA